MPSERAIRTALAPVAVATAQADGHGVGLVEEFTIPPGGSRADIVVIGEHLVGYEIKSAADSLRRLPAQVASFGRVFDYCWLVAATRHVEPALDHLPEWWGVMEVEHDPGLTRLVTRRPPSSSPTVELEALVRLLWRDEVAAAIRCHDQEPEVRRGRSAMWAQLLACGTDASIRAAVRDALRARRSWRGAAGLDRLKLSPGVAH